MPFDAPPRVLISCCQRVMSVLDWRSLVCRFVMPTALQAEVQSEQNSINIQNCVLTLLQALATAAKRC